mgnify:CR=1 FL=1|jgi:uncharacterized protein (TIGR01244 family)
MQRVCVAPRLVRGLVTCIAVLSIGIAGVSVSSQEEVPAGIRNYTRIDATVACAGATPSEAMPALKELGFASVINFRTAEEEGANIDGSQAAASEAGLKYIHIPFRAPNDETTETFLAAIADPSNQPAYIHCASANRVGAMWFIKRVKQDGWDQDRALAEAETIGLRSERLKEFATSYVNR